MPKVIGMRMHYLPLFYSWRLLPVEGQVKRGTPK